jgi:hypothetical protein
MLQGMDIPEGMPFTVVASHERVIITLHGDAGQSTQLAHEASYRWISGQTALLELDFSRVRMVNSVLFAWLFSLIQAGRISCMVVSKANDLVVNQIRQLYLDRIVSITYAPG